MRTYALENRGRAPLYEYLYRCIRGDILDGTLTAGERLPSKRALAEHLHISVMTVEGAYQQLEAEGYVKQCADKYIGLGQCKDHGAVLIRLRFQPTDDGKRIMHMTTAFATAANRAYIHTKRLQVAEKEARYLAEHGALPDPEEELMNAERSSMPFED